MKYYSATIARYVIIAFNTCTGYYYCEGDAAPARGAHRISGRDCRSACQKARGSCVEYTKLFFLNGRYTKLEYMIALVA